MPKKFLSILLSVLMILTMAPISYAVETPTLTVSSVTGAPGETITLDVSLSNNPGIVSANLKIAFDEGLTLIGAENSDVFSTLTYIPPKQLSSGGQITSSCQFAWTGFDIADQDIKNGKILSLKFKIAEDAEIGELYNVAISSESGDVIDKNLNAVILSANSTVEVSETQAESPLSISSVTGTPGEIVTLDVSLADNPGIVSANLKVAFDEGLTLVGAENGDVFSTLTYIPPKQLSSGGQITSSCQFAWTGFDIADDDGVVTTVKTLVEELQATNPDDYKEVCYKIGEAYLFCYKTAGNANYERAAFWFEDVKDDYSLAAVTCETYDCLKNIQKYRKTGQTVKEYEEYQSLWKKVETLQTNSDSYDDDLKLLVWNSIVDMIRDNAVEFYEVASETEVVKMLKTISTNSAKISSKFHTKEKVVNLQNNVATTITKIQSIKTESNG